MKWIWIILALLYLISPYDLIPGLHLPGFLDDAVVLGFLLRYLMKLKGRSGMEGSSPHDSQSSQSQSTSEDGASDVRNLTPHEVLGVSPDADKEEIQGAYRKLANQYHPDKVAHLGEEFQVMAEKRFKEIQKAYDDLTR